MRSIPDFGAASAGSRISAVLKGELVLVANTVKDAI